jgi:zinc transporter, ZIP family
VIEAVGWGAVAAASLLIGVALAFARRWSKRSIGLVLGFGAGALISAVSFELAEEGLAAGDPKSVAGGLAAGAFVFYLADGLIARMGAGHARERRSEGGAAGPALALGAFLDGIPEQLVLGLGLASGAKVSLGLLAAIFVSNLPEAVGSASSMRDGGSGRGEIVMLWLAVAVVCALASGVGYLAADAVSGDAVAAINGFAAGALLVMLVDSMIPEAAEQSGRVAGLVTTLGFAVATGLSTLT